MTKLSTIGQIPMVVKDVPRAVTFYRDTLGMLTIHVVLGTAEVTRVARSFARSRSPLVNDRLTVAYFLRPLMSDSRRPAWQSAALYPSRQGNLRPTLLRFQLRVG
jgi:hypothetical protein